MRPSWLKEDGWVDDDMTKLQVKGVQGGRYCGKYTWLVKAQQDDSQQREGKGERAKKK